MQKAYVIVGPTASGKSAYAVRLAKKVGGEVISIDWHNPRRLIRAIEIAEALGKVPRMQKRAPEGIKFEWIGIDLPDKKLKKKIHLRLLSRMRGGMLAEVKRLHTRGLSWKRMESFGLEYRWLARYLQNKITKE